MLSYTKHVSWYPHAWVIGTIARSRRRLRRRACCACDLSIGVPQAGMNLDTDVPITIETLKTSGLCVTSVNLFVRVHHLRDSPAGPTCWHSAAPAARSRPGRLRGMQAYVFRWHLVSPLRQAASDLPEP
jgi:hypothetical protein